jgi:hypothetical protein
MAKAMSSTIWIGIGAIAAGVAAVFTLIRGQLRKDNRGAVSDQWVAQHRSDPSDQ